MGLRASAIAVLGLPLVAYTLGCQEASKPASNASGDSAANGQGTSELSEAHTESVRISNVLTLWESGKNDDAVRQLVLIRWDAPDIFADASALSLSEDRFASLSQAEKTGMQQEVIELVPKLKAIARHALSAGDDARSAGDKEMAVAHYEAVRHFGEALSGSERLLVIQQIGKPIAAWAEEKESAVK